MGPLVGGLLEIFVGSLEGSLMKSLVGSLVGPSVGPRRLGGARTRLKSVRGRMGLYQRVSALCTANETEHIHLP